MSTFWYVFHQGADSYRRRTLNFFFRNWHKSPPQVYNIDFFSAHVLCGWWMTGLSPYVRENYINKHRKKTRGRSDEGQRGRKIEEEPRPKYILSFLRNPVECTGYWVMHNVFCDISYWQWAWTTTTSTDIVSFYTYSAPPPLPPT